MRPLLPLCALVALAPGAAAQIVVLDGTDLQAVVDAALSGDVIELQSNGTFSGIEIVDKSLTIRAADGFTPSIAGPGAAGPEALRVGASAEDGDHEVWIEGLLFTAGAGDAVRILGAPAATTIDLALTFDECVIDGNVLGEEALGRTLELSIEESVVGSLDALRPNATSSVFRLAGSSVFDLAWFRSPGTLDVTDTVFRDRVILGESTDGALSGELRRCSFLETVEARSTDSSAVDLLFESSLFQRSSALGTGVGFLLRQIQQPASARVLNCTFRDFAVGLGGVGGADIEGVNLLFDGNGDDIAFEGASATSTVRSSLIPDGTFAGLAGNVQGSASFGCGNALIASTLGVDLGNPLAPDLGLTDLFGNPRIQDGDGDGTAIPSVGAVESTATFGSSTTVINGTGINPEHLTALTAPQLGTTLELTIQTFAPTLATAVLIDLPAAAPFPSPLGLGELHVELSPALTDQLLAPGGSHSLPIPPAPELLGLGIRIQGLRVDLNAGIATYPALNSLDVDFGGC